MNCMKRFVTCVASSTKEILLGDGGLVSGHTSIKCKCIKKLYEEFHDQITSIECKYTKKLNEKFHDQIIRALLRLGHFRGKIKESVR